PPGVFTDILLLFWRVLPTTRLSEAPEVMCTPATLPVIRLPSIRLKVAPGEILMPAQAQSFTLSCVTTRRVPLISMQSSGPWITGRAPLPYEPKVIGLSAVPALDRVSGPGQTPPRLKSTRSPAANVTLLTLPSVRQAVLRSSRCCCHYLPHCPRSR